MKRVLTLFALLCMVLSAASAVETEKVFGLYKVVLHEKTGTFSLFITDISSGKFIPVLSTLDNASGTQLYVQMADSVYVLNPRAGVSVTQLFTENGFKSDYLVKNKALVVLEMKFVSSTSGVPADIAVIDIVVQNSSQAAASMAVKAVFDTMLGETSLRHFSTAKKVSINEEISIQGMQSDRYLRSSDGSSSFQFILDGAETTAPETVTVANRDLLLTSVWMPISKPGRGFNSLFSFNNSAVCIYWPAVKLAPAAKTVIRFYFSAASAEMLPPDSDAPFFTGKNPTVSQKESLSPEAPVQQPVVPETKAVQPESPQPSKTQAPPVTAPAPEALPAPKKEEKPSAAGVKAPETKPAETKPAETKPAEPKKAETKPETSEKKIPVPSVPPVPAPEKKNLTKEQLDPEYVSNLLARIRKLESDTDSLNKEEITRLNQELDAILEQVRQE